MMSDHDELQCLKDHAEFEAESLEKGLKAYHGYLLTCSMKESGFMLNAMQAARTAMWDHFASHPFLFALTEDRLGCTLDIDGQARHYVEDSRVENLLLDAGRYRMARALACGYTSERGQTIVVELPRPNITASIEGSGELLDAAIDAYIDDHPTEARHANEE